MNGYSQYQMTLDEMINNEARPPIKKRGHSIGQWIYECPICGWCIGIYGDEYFHEHGWLYKRDVCKNGHYIKWEE